MRERALKSAFVEMFSRVATSDGGTRCAAYSSKACEVDDANSFRISLAIGTRFCERLKARTLMTTIFRSQDRNNPIPPRWQNSPTLATTTASVSYAMSSTSDSRGTNGRIQPSSNGRYSPASSLRSSVWALEPSRSNKLNGISTTPSVAWVGPTGELLAKVNTPVSSIFEYPKKSLRSREA